MYSDYVYLYDKKDAGVSGGNSVSGAWRTRDITDEVEDVGNVCSLVANQFTLQAGTYRISASVPHFRSTEHQARLYNISDTSMELLGTSEVNITSQNQGQTRSFIVGRFTIAVPKVFEIQYRVKNGHINSGLGTGNVWAEESIYTVIELWRET